MATRTMSTVLPSPAALLTHGPDMMLASAAAMGAASSSAEKEAVATATAETGGSETAGFSRAGADAPAAAGSTTPDAAGVASGAWSPVQISWQHQELFASMQPPKALLASDMTNAIEAWQNICSSMHGKRPVVFLDYDGTLSPIVKEPDNAHMKDGMRSVLRRVSAAYTTAIITGRSREKVYQFVQLDDVYYAGSHGFDISGPDGDGSITCQVGDQFRPLLEDVRQQLEDQLSAIPGTKVEDNKFALSVHYRNVPDQYVELVFEIVSALVERQPDLALKHGKKVLELRPKVDWNKGSAVLWIMRQLGLDTAEDIFPFYLGDDITDEDAFVALHAFGPSSPQLGGVGRSAGILVREDNDLERQPETHASFKLRNPDEVQQFLELLLTLGV